MKTRVLLATTIMLSAVSFRLSAVSCQLSAFGSAFSFRLSAVSFRLSAARSAQSADILPGINQNLGSPTLHFICGKAGAGKTTLARRLGRDLPAIVICEDEWLLQIAAPITSVEQYLEASRRLRNAIAPHVIELLRLGNHVVLDFGASNTPRGRSWVRSIFEAAGADHVLHHLLVDDATSLTRVRQRNESRPEGVFFGVVADSLVQEINKYVTPPGVEERFHVVDHPTE